jgi:endonuclease III
MATTTNKQRVLNQVFAAQPKGMRDSDEGKAEARPVLEQFLYAICREGVSPERAQRAYRALRERFFDWNEIRVSSAREVAEVLCDLPDPEGRAQRIVDLLQEVFETTFSFDLDSIQKKGLKQAAKQLTRYRAANDYAVSWVVQQSLGGHAIPLDAPSLRVLRRLGLIEGEPGDLEALRASLEHQIPKSRGPLFNDLISTLAEDYCWEESPGCPSCPMAASCPTGQEVRAAHPSAGRPHKSR